MVAGRPARAWKMPMKSCRWSGRRPSNAWRYWVSGLASRALNLRLILVVLGGGQFETKTPDFLRHQDESPECDYPVALEEHVFSSCQADALGPEPHGDFGVVRVSELVRTPMRRVLVGQLHDDAERTGQGGVLRGDLSGVQRAGSAVQADRVALDPAPGRRR